MCDSGPEAPDPQATAAAQQQTNTLAAQQTASLNRPNLTTPLGNLTWAVDPNDPTRYTGSFTPGEDFDRLTRYGGTSSSTGSSQASSNSFSSSSQQSQSQASTRPTAIDEQMLEAYKSIMPQLQDRLLRGTQQNVASAASAAAPRFDWTQVAENALGRMQPLSGNLEQKSSITGQTDAAQAEQLQRLMRTYRNPMDYSGVSAMPTASDATRSSVEDALYQRSQSRLDPQFQQRASDLESRLAAQGITQGSEAYRRELDNLGRERTDAYAAARNDAASRSTDDMVKQFGLGMAARQQGVNEANYIRERPTAEALALSQIGSANTTGLNQLAGQQTNQFATAGQLGSLASASELARGAQSFSQATSQNNVDMDNLLRYFQALRSGGQASLSTSSSTSSGGSSSGSNSSQSSTQESQAQNGGYNLPGFLTNLSGNSGASVQPVNIAGLEAQQYATGQAAANSTNQGLATVGSAGLMALAQAGMLT